MSTDNWHRIVQKAIALYTATHQSAVRPWHQLSEAERAELLQNARAEFLANGGPNGS